MALRYYLNSKVDVQAKNNVHHGFPVLTLPYLILMKLEASRMLDLADIGRMLRYADSAARAKVRAIIMHYRPDDLEDLEQIILLEETSI